MRKTNNNDNHRIKKDRIAHFCANLFLLLIAAVDQIKVFLPFLVLRE